MKALKHTITIFCSALALASSAQTPLDYVDTRVGTAFATTNTAGRFGKGSEEHGQTLPSVGVPHGMNLWTPQTRDTEQKCIAPYYFADSLLQGFRNSHWIVGGCTQDYGSMTMQALSGELRFSPESRATIMDRTSELARPDYYRIKLPNEGIKAEMTGLSRSAIFRFTYDHTGKGHLVVNPNSDEGQGRIEIDTERRQIRGENPVHRIYQGWGEPAGFSGYFTVQLPDDIKITDWGTFPEGTGAYVTFETVADSPVLVKVGSSFTSIDAAVANLKAEIPGWDFDEVRAESAKAWNERLGIIEVDGGDLADRAKFYGSLWRSSLLPRVVSDVDGAYAVFATSGKTAYIPKGHDYYDDFSMWDTYRALHPLLNIIDPERSGDMVQSLVVKAQVGGWMPIFPCWNSYTAAMIGDHCAVTIADAAVKGITGVDYNEAYRYLRKNAFEMPADYREYADGMGRRALDSYIRYGYIPLEDSVPEAFHQREQTSRTLEYAFDDFALSRLALMLGKSEDAAELTRRSGNWRNVIDSNLGYANGRYADGRFAVGTDPFTFNKAITEGAPCHYTWYVPHDPEGLVEALGGAAAFESKLDSMFTHGRYWHGNEPCHQVVYMFDAVNRPEKTRRWVRHIMDTEYLNEPGGLSGNDDAGQMSAWYVFSAMGFYPVAPSIPEYWLGAPLFDRVTLHLPTGDFVVENSHVDNPSLIRSTLLNGKAIKRLPHNALTSGAKLSFE